MPDPLQSALAELAAIGRELLAIDPTMPETDPQLWADMLEGETRTNAFELLDQFVLAALELNSRAEALRTLRADWGLRQCRLEAAITRRRNIVLRLFDTLRLNKLERPAYTASVTAGRSHVVPTLPPEEMPDRFRRVSYEADKTALGNALRAGVPDVPAEWSNPQPSLAIRTR